MFWDAAEDHYSRRWSSNSVDTGTDCCSDKSATGTRVGKHCSAARSGTDGAELCQAAVEALSVCSGIDEPPWSRVYEGTGITIHVSQGDDGLLCVAVQALYDAPLVWFLALVREFDLMCGWNRYVPVSQILRVATTLSAEVYGEIWMPWPLSHRSILLRAEGIDLLDEQGCVLALASSMSVSQDPSLLPATAADCKTITLLPGSCLRLVPTFVSGSLTSRTEMTLLLRLQSRVASVPSWIMQQVVGIAGPWVHSAVQGQLESLRVEDNPYRQRIAANEELYGVVQRRCDEFAARRNNKLLKTPAADASGIQRHAMETQSAGAPVGCFGSFKRMAYIALYCCRCQ